MYQPAHFVEARSEVLQAAIRDHPLGTLVTMNRAGALQANPLPFLLDANDGPAGTLRGHVARANPVWRDTRDDVEALVVFQGVDGYVSPSWYPSKTQGGKVVPTWNYVVVQARGRLRVVDDAVWLRAFVTRLTERFESGRAVPWHVGDAPADYIESMLEAIVGVEIELTSLAGKYKLSQNRPAADRAGVIAGLHDLAERKADPFAAMMAAAIAERSH